MYPALIAAISPLMTEQSGKVLGIKFILCREENKTAIVLSCAHNRFKPALRKKPVGISQQLLPCLSSVKRIYRLEFHNTHK